MSDGSSATTQAAIDALTVGEALEAIAARTPTPGGGAVAAVVGALGAALGRMVVSFSIGKKSLAEHDGDNALALTQLQAMTQDMLSLAAKDADAFAGLNALWKLPEHDPQRQSGWDDAVAAAIAAPRSMLARCVEMLELLETLVGRTNDMLRSDLAIAAILAAAGARAAAWNVGINLPLVTDEAQAEALAEEISTAVGRADELSSAIEQACGEG